MRYSEVVKNSNRFMGTNDRAEYSRWVRILDDKLIRYKVYVRQASRDKWDFRFELIGYTKEENEKIKDLVGFYYDEEDGE